MWQAKKAAARCRPASRALHPTLPPDDDRDDGDDGVRYAAAFGAIQQMPRIVPGCRSAALARTAQEQAISGVQPLQEFSRGWRARYVRLQRLAAGCVVSRPAGSCTSFQIPGLVLPGRGGAHAFRAAERRAAWPGAVGNLLRRHGDLSLKCSVLGQRSAARRSTTTCAHGRSLPPTSGPHSPETMAALVTTQLRTPRSQRRPVPSKLCLRSGAGRTGCVRPAAFAASVWLPRRRRRTCLIGINRCSLPNEHRARAAPRLTA
jgi:hypothetical protein